MTGWRAEALGEFARAELEDPSQLRRHDHVG